LKETHSYHAHEIAAMNKTGLWFNMPGWTTVEERGAKNSQCENHRVWKGLLYGGFRC
jgi:hypothetical protein